MGSEMCIRDRPQWTRLLSLLGRQDVLEKDWFASAAGRNSNSVFLYGILVEEMPKADTDQWVQRLEQIDIPHSRINTLDDLLHDPHLRQTGFFNTSDNLNGRQRSVSQPITYHGVDSIPDSAAPEIGENTFAILEQLGYSTEQIVELQRAGVLRE